MTERANTTTLEETQTMINLTPTMTDNQLINIFYQHIVDNDIMLKTDIKSVRELAKEIDMGEITQDLISIYYTKRTTNEVKYFDNNTHLPLWDEVAKEVTRYFVLANLEIDLVRNYMYQAKQYAIAVIMENVQDF